MFDTDNKSGSNPETKDAFNRKIFIACGAILVVSVALIIGIIAAITLGPKNPGGGSSQDVGLKNPNRLTDPEPVTAEEIDKEYEQRPEIEPEAPAEWEATVTKFLSRGDYASLDSYLQEEMKKYKNLRGDEGQGIDDWREQFDMLRGDIAKAANITSDKNPERTLTQFCSPEVLAAAVIWAPVSTKMDAFEDSSSIILPSPENGDIGLHAVAPSETGNMLQEVDFIVPNRYMDLAAYDAVVFGYNVRIILVADQTGYYRPWSITALDNDINTEVWSKSALIKVRNNLDPYSDLDSVLYPPIKGESSGEVPAIQDEDNPEKLPDIDEFLKGKELIDGPETTEQEPEASFSTPEAVEPPTANPEDIPAT